jgi:hypothetical protein
VSGAQNPTVQDIFRLSMAMFNQFRDCNLEQYEWLRLPYHRIQPRMASLVGQHLLAICSVPAWRSLRLGKTWEVYRPAIYLQCLPTRQSLLQLHR